MFDYLKSELGYIMSHLGKVEWDGQQKILTTNGGMMRPSRAYPLGTLRGL